MLSSSYFVQCIIQLRKLKTSQTTMHATCKTQNGVVYRKFERYKGFIGEEVVKILQICGWFQILCETQS